MNGRRFAGLGLAGLAATVGGCQLVSGLSGYQESGSSAGVTASSGGGATSSSVGGAGGEASSASVTTGASSTGSGGAGGSECAPGEAKCGMAGVCTGLMSNADNCGECGHVCHGLNGDTGVCLEGLCAPVAISPLYDAGQPVTALVADATSGVFWAVGAVSSALYGFETDGTVHSLSAVGVLVGGLATHNARVFYTAFKPAGTGLFEWLLPTDSDVKIDLQMGLKSVGGAVTGDGENVFWAAQFTNSSWHVYWIHLAGGMNAGPYAVAPAPVFAADDTNVYWPYSGTHVEKLDAANGTPVNFIDILFNAPDYFAADGVADLTGHLYGIRPGSLYRFTKNNNQAQAPEDHLNVTITKPTGLVASATGGVVYWLEDSTAGKANGKLLRSEVWNQAPTIVANHLKSPKNLTMDGKYLYFSAGATNLDPRNQVYRVTP